jgi:hypothetical protein
VLVQLGSNARPVQTTSSRRGRLVSLGKRTLARLRQIRHLAILNQHLLRSAAAVGLQTWMTIFRFADSSRDVNGLQSDP